MRKPAVNIAIRAARAAARVLIRYLNQADSLKISEKRKNDFVTAADHAAERAIIYEIHKAYPDHAVLSEEAGQIGEGDIRWIVDPLDGTRNFIHDIPHFAISIALEERGRMELGVIYDPIREELFTASRGNGAFLNDRRIRVSDQKAMDGAVLATGFPFRARERLSEYLAMFGGILAETGDVRRAGSAALDLAYVAAGRLDGFWELGLSAWDMAAGAVLIQEAGGIATDFAGGYDYLSSGNIIAGNLKIAAKLQTLVRANWQD